LFLDFRNHTIPTTKIRIIPPPRRQNNIPREPCAFVVGSTVADGSKVEVGEICVPPVDERVAVKMGIVPGLSSPVVVGTALGIVSIVGLVVKPGV